MKDKDQYNEIVVKHWNQLVSVVDSSENLATCLYNLATATYMIAEHDRIETINTAQIVDKPFVFANGKMQLSEDVIISSNMSSNIEIKEIPKIRNYHPIHD